MKSGLQAWIGGLAVGLATALARAEAPEPAGEVVVLVDGLDAQALAAALALRVPAARVDGLSGAGCAGGRCTFARLRREPGALQVELRLADGRMFRRSWPAEIDEPERAAATALAHLLAAIDEGAATPEPVERAPAPAPEPASPTPPPAREPPPGTAPPGGDVPQPAASSRPVASATTPRLEIGPLVGLTALVGVGRPSALAGRIGDGGLVGLELRRRGGLLVDIELRGLGFRDGGLRVGRLRLAAALGYSLRRRLFELRTRAALTVEPWWVSARADGARTEFGGPLLGGALAVAPGLSAALAPGVRVSVGLRFEATLSVDARNRGILQLVDSTGAPLFRMGGIELGIAAEIGVRWGRP